MRLLEWLRGTTAITEPEVVGTNGPSKSTETLKSENAEARREVTQAAKRLHEAVNLGLEQASGHTER